MGRSIVAKLCDGNTQHFASVDPDDPPMEEPRINQVLAEALAFYMRRHWTNVSLAKASGVAEGTIRNYLSPEKRAAGKSGKHPSAKLTELAQIADAMGLRVEDLVRDATDAERAAILRQRAAEHYQQTGTLPPWAPGPEAATAPAAALERYVEGELANAPPPAPRRKTAEAAPGGPSRARGPKRAP
jgi:hypothetical protein